MPNPFNQWIEAYEAMIDWPKRLANEELFFRWLFGRVEARDVLDVACGTGHHAAMFHGWGLRVEGADLSPGMIDRCRAQWGEPEGLHWLVRGFDQPAGEGRFDVALCIGNSLALAPDLPAVHTIIRRMLEALRPGGLAIIQVLNLWQLPDGQCRWQKCRRADLQPGQDHLIIKGVHRGGDRGYVDLLVTRVDTSPPELQADCIPFLGLHPADLEGPARAASAAATEVYGTYHRDGYDPARSPDLILIAQKARAGT
jgi:SAM-dependent methyltransferase